MYELDFSCTKVCALSEKKIRLDSSRLHSLVVMVVMVVCEVNVGVLGILLPTKLGEYFTTSKRNGSQSWAKFTASFPFR
jgi:hypothetical protein